MHLLLVKRFTATALCKQVLYSAPTIWTGIASGQSRTSRHTARITRASLHESSRRFYSDDAGAVDPSWVRRVTEVPAPVSKPQATEVLTSTPESEVGTDGQARASTVKKWKKSPAKAKKSYDDASPFTIPTAAELDTIGFTGNWPTTPKMLEAARDFIETAAKSPHAVLLMPDHDPDGLSAGTIISQTLQLLGKPADLIHVHFVQKGRPIPDQKEKEKAEVESLCQELNVGHIIILDQGSRERAGALVIPPPPSGSKAPRWKTLIIDHYKKALSTHNTTILSSYGHTPIASTSLLAYILCCTLHPTAPDATALLALVGTLSNLSSTPATLNMLRSPPVSIYLNTAPALKKYTTKWINMLISLLNVSQRGPEGSDTTRAAWDILQFNPNDNPTEWPTPKQILSGTWGSQQLRDTVTRLTTLQERCRGQMDKWKRTPPKYSSDGKIAVIEISSPWYIHTLLAVRWVHYLGTQDLQNPNGPRLLALVVANRDNVRKRVDFSVRRTTLAAETDVDTVALLREYADKLPSDMREKMGVDFVGWHKEALRGSLELEVWTRYRGEVMKVPDIGRGGNSGAISGVFVKASGAKEAKEAKQAKEAKTTSGNGIGAAAEAVGVVE